MIVKIVPVHLVDEVWPLISDRVVSCLRKTPSELRPYDLWVLCRSGNGFLIVAEAGGLILGVTVWKFSSADYFECLLIVGEDADLWFEDTLKLGLQVASDNGAKGIGGTSRVGLTKLMKRHFPQMKIVRQTYVVGF